MGTKDSANANYACHLCTVKVTRISDAITKLLFRDR